MATSEYTQPRADGARPRPPAYQRDSGDFSADATDRLPAKLGQAVANASAAPAEAAGTRNIRLFDRASVVVQFLRAKIVLLTWNDNFNAVAEDTRDMVLWDCATHADELSYLTGELASSTAHDYIEKPDLLNQFHRAALSLEALIAPTHADSGEGFFCLDDGLVLAYMEHLEEVSEHCAMLMNAVSEQISNTQK